MKFKRKLILASQSPQRRQLMRKLRIPFKISPARISENSREKNPRALVTKLALKKATHVARKHRDALVLGADTVVVCQGEILVKPTSRSDSLRMISMLNGRWHRVYTGVALIDSRTGDVLKAIAVSRIKARKLDPRALARLAGKHMDKSGGYAVQDHKDPLIQKVVGPLDNVIGLPLKTVRDLIRKYRVSCSHKPKVGKFLAA